MNDLTTTNNEPSNGEIATLRDTPQNLHRLAYEPSNWSEAVKAAAYLWQSGMLPSAIKSPQAAVALVVYGRERGMSLMQSLTMIHVIEGRPSVSADGMVALIKSSSACVWWRLVESTREHAVFETLRKDAPAPVRYEYTIEDAKDAGLTGRGNWAKHLRAMLRARGASGLARIEYPDVCGGMYTEDEIEDFRGAIPATIVAPQKPVTRADIIAAAPAAPAAAPVTPTAPIEPDDIPADAPHEPKVEPAPDPAKAAWLAEGETLIAEYAKLTPKPGESDKDALHRAAQRLGSRRGKNTPDLRAKWLSAARETVASLGEPVDETPWEKPAEAAPATPPVTATPPAVSAVADVLGATVVPPRITAHEFTAKVAEKRMVLAGMIRGDQEDEVSAKRRAAELLGRAVYGTPEGREAEAWLANAERVMDAQGER